MMNELIQDLDKCPVAQQTSVIEQVPIIDIGELVEDASSSAAESAVSQIANACQTWGFFQITNHGITDDLIQHVWSQTRALFSLPLEQKQQVLRSKDNLWGYYSNELTKNQRDKKEVYDFTHDGIDPIYGKANRWPDNQQDFRLTMQNYFVACTQLSLNLLGAFCLGLDLPADHMRSDFATNHTGFLRLNYYPVEDPLKGEKDGVVKKASEADLGVHHHTDAGALTVLLQDDVGGLQVYRDGFWHNIPPVPGALVINTGDMMQVWSNDIYQAPVHRVLAMDSIDRYSLPFFFNPAATARVSPLPTVVDQRRPSAYRSIEWAKFRGKRTDGDYADYGTEVQISQFRI